ncbi:hypothetical protein H7K38_14405 [Mycobacterium alsense]|uniref:PE-PGRS family protein n=1 Tax=Mycobacterium alsense TaxID=324058 RepID=A0AA42C063_9MYCO|nr:hypothetical protein [Mycobacterium alsense]MCV7379839.1 hypothetical protein [Mycobacterium alsense]
MDLAARRPHISAGIALASAAVIAAGPMTQHLPKLDAAHYLPKVSVTEINLTDAASPMMDLFAGVEDQLASLAGGASAAAVPAAALTDFLNPATLPLPVATWVNVFQNAGTNLQTVLSSWQTDPFPIARQMLANWAQYGIDYITPYHTAAIGAAKYFGTTTNVSFWGYLKSAWSGYLSGNMIAAKNGVYNAFLGGLEQPVLLPLEKTLTFIPQIPQNFTNLVNGLVGIPADGVTPSSLTTLGLLAVGMGTQPFVPIGTTLQNISNAYNAGNLPAMLGYAADFPGELANAVINSNNVSYGILSTNRGLLNTFANIIPQALAGQMVAPNAQNLSTGGSLAVSGQQLVNALTTGWPDLTPVINTTTNELTAWLQQIPSVVSNLPTLLSGAIGSLASHIGLIIANLLKLL